MDEDAFNLSPQLAHMLATMSTPELVHHFGEEALLIARFVQGREKRELPPPTQEEIERVARWHAQVLADQSLLGLTLKGMAYVDFQDDGEMVWQITADGREALSKE